MPVRQPIATDQAPTPTGPFNQGVRIGNLVFTSGQAGRNRETGEMGDAEEQTDWALRNLAGILEAGGLSLDHVAKLTLFVKEGTDSKLVNEAYVRHFSEPLPARSLVFVSRLKNPEMLVEIEAVAVDA